MSSITAGRAARTIFARAARCVEQIDRLVRQLAPADVAARQRDRGAHRLVLDDDAVRLLEPPGEAADHQRRDLDRRLLHLHGLEAALERGVLFEVLLVLGPRRRRDGAELAARERGLEEVRRVAAALRTAGADEGVRLVDEEDDRLGRGLHLGDDALESVLELALHARAGLESAEVEREDVHVLQLLGDVALGDREGEPLDERRLSDAGLADDDGVVLAPADEDVDDAADLRLAPEDGVEPALLRALREVGGEAGERPLGRAEARRRPLRGLAPAGARGPGRGCGALAESADRGGLAASGAAIVARFLRSSSRSIFSSAGSSNGR